MDHDTLESGTARLQDALRSLGSVVIGFSGGVDSTLLLRVAVDVLGRGRVLAVTARSPSFPEREMKEARETARVLGVRHVVIDTDEMRDSHFTSNPRDRCYYCKKELFRRLGELKEDAGFAAVADATNRDDAESDERPGLRAAAEMGVRSPLREAGLGKADIRALSRQLGLAGHDKPSFACLASRIPYGEEITDEKLRRIDRAEGLLRALGFRQVRVRSHDRLARIELGPEENAARLLEGQRRSDLVAALKGLGYTYVTLDLEGYRTGSMNETPPMRADAP